MTQQMTVNDPRRFVGWRDLGEMALQLTLVIHPLWLFLFGISLLRERAPALVGTGMAPAA